MKLPKELRKKIKSIVKSDVKINDNLKINNITEDGLISYSLCKALNEKFGKRNVIISVFDVNKGPIILKKFEALTNYSLDNNTKIMFTMPTNDFKQEGGLYELNDELLRNKPKKLINELKNKEPIAELELDYKTNCFKSEDFKINDKISDVNSSLVILLGRELGVSTQKIYAFYRDINLGLNKYIITKKLDMGRLAKRNGREIRVFLLEDNADINKSDKKITRIMNKIKNWINKINDRKEKLLLTKFYLINSKVGGLISSSSTSLGSDNELLIEIADITKSLFLK